MQTIGFGFSRYDNPKTQAMPLWKKKTNQQQQAGLLQN